MYEPKIINGLPGNFGQLKRALEEGWQLVAVVPSKARQDQEYYGNLVFAIIEASAYLVRPKENIVDYYRRQSFFTTTTEEVSSD